MVVFRNVNEVISISPWEWDEAYINQESCISPVLCIGVVALERCALVISYIVVDVEVCGSLPELH